MKAAQSSSNFENKKIPAYSLLPYAENIAWQLWFVVQFCFLLNSSLKFKSPISLLDSTIKKSWLIKCSQAKLSETLKKMLYSNSNFSIMDLDKYESRSIEFKLRK